MIPRKRRIKTSIKIDEDGDRVIESEIVKEEDDEK